MSNSIPLNPKHPLTCLLLALLILMQGQSQFTTQTNKPVTNQESFKQTNPSTTAQTTSDNQEDSQIYNPKPSSQFRRIPTSQQYNTLFAEQIKKISLSEVVNATIISNGKEICADSQPCEFYYYVIKPKFDPQEIRGFDFSGSGSVRNVFVMSGMHGNEFLGPTAMLYAVKYLETPGTRVILFPLANPSGYDHNTRLTYPTNIDPNRDFPIEQYKKCYQSSSSLIIDHIYRKYHIDLTLALHNGRSEIGWAWGTMRERINSHTKDELIYRDIGEWLKFVGGKNRKIQMETFNIGTINEVVYPVEGGFEDWAYAASWYTASVSTAPNRNCNYLKFPFNMTNGLVFLFELGPFHVTEQKFGSEQGLNIYPTSTNVSNGYISRSIRMLSGLVKIPNPRLEIKFTKESLVVRLNGCKQGLVDQLNITRKSDGLKHLEMKKTIQMKGSLSNKTVDPTVISLQLQVSDPTLKPSFELQTIIVEYSLTCDPLWKGNGNTVFGQGRLFEVKESIILSASVTPHLLQTYYTSRSAALAALQYLGDVPIDSLPDQLGDFVDENSDFLVVFCVLAVVLSVMVFVVLVICRQIAKDRKKRRVKKVMRKLERVGAGERVMSEEEGEESSRQQMVANSGSNSKPLPGRKVQSYPHMCESDKSMKNDELGQVVELGKFIQNADR